MFWDAGKYTKHTWLGKGIYLTPAAYAWCLGRIDVGGHPTAVTMFTPAIEQLWLNGLNGTGVKTPLRL